MAERVERLESVEPEGNTELALERLETVGRTESQARLLAQYNGPDEVDRSIYEVFVTEAAASRRLEEYKRRFASMREVQINNTYPSETCVQVSAAKTNCFRKVDTAVVVGETIAADESTPISETNALILMRTAFKHWMEVMR